MDVQKLWPEMLQLLREEWGSQVIETWLKSAVPVRYDVSGQVLYITVPNPFVRDWVVKHYLGSLSTACNRVLMRHDCQVQVAIAADAEPARVSADHIIPARPLGGTLLSGTPEGSFTDRVAPAARVTKTPVKPAATVSVRPASSAPASTAVRVAGTHKPSFQSLYAHYTFDRFVEGPHNSLAYHAARAVAEQPGSRYNPYYLYGPSGLGKTHLLHAIAHEAAARFPRMHILYQPAERFVQDFIQAIRQQRMQQFTARYQDLDMLLIDDIHCISHKEQTQEAFFKIFNVLHQAGKQIICTSDVAPIAIAGFAERMRSRLQWGLVADVSIPTFETKIAIIKKKADLAGFIMSDEVVEYIARLVKGSIRQLEGALMRLMAYRSMVLQADPQDLSGPASPVVFSDIESVKKILQSLQPEYAEHTATPETVQSSTLPMTIVKAVCAHYQVAVDDLRSASRDQRLVRVRHVAVYALKQFTKASLREIGSYIGRKDHSTVLHAYERIARLKDTQQDIQACLSSVERGIAAARD